MMELSGIWTFIVVIVALIDGLYFRLVEQDWLDRCFNEPAEIRFKADPGRYYYFRANQPSLL